MSDILPTRPPWKTDAYLIVAEVPGGRPGGEVIAQCRPTRSGILTEAQNKANAEFIVRMVNASLSPIALDFEAAEREADIAFERYGLSGPHANTAYNDALNAQLRALVARVAQEERERGRREAFQEAFDVYHGTDKGVDAPENSTPEYENTTFSEWLNAQPRGTP